MGRARKVIATKDNTTIVGGKGDEASVKERVVQIKKLIQHLDKSGPQFLIRAKIINVDRQYQKALGVLFQTENQNTNPIAPLTLIEPNLTTGAGQFTVSIAKLAGDHLLNLQMLYKNNH